MARMNRSLALAAALMLLGACGKASEAPPTGPGDFALSLPMEAARGGAVQRVVLPAAALVAVKRADRGDIRAFDAGGRPLSTALLGEAETRVGEARFDAIPVTPPPDGAAGSGVSVRVDQGGRMVTVDTAGGKPAASAGSVLFDTRKVKDRAQAIAIDADLPRQRPVTLTIEASADLKTWQPLAEQVLFRPGEAPALLGSGRIALPGTPLEDRYLRASWSDAPEVVIRGATVYTSQTPPLARIVVPASGQALADSHHLNFALPPGPAPAALRVIMTGKDGVVPLRLLGRDAVDEPWALLAVTSLKQDRTGAVLECGGCAKRELRLEADPRGAGFSQPPRLEFAFDPIVLLVALNGNPPYHLAVGNPAAEPAFFAASDLADHAAPYPLARVEGGQAGVTIDLAGTAGGSAATLRTLALWAALIVGALILAFAAYRLFRENAATP